MEEGILAIRLRALGDVALVTPALRALHRGHPGRPLEVVTETRYAGLLEGLPGVARVWPAERTHASTAALARELGSRRFAWAVDFFGNPRSALPRARERRAAARATTCGAPAPTTCACRGVSSPRRGGASTRPRPTCGWRSRRAASYDRRARGGLPRPRATESRARAGAPRIRGRDPPAVGGRGGRRRGRARVARGGEGSGARRGPRAARARRGRAGWPPGGARRGRQLADQDLARVARRAAGAGAARRRARGAAARRAGGGAGRGGPAAARSGDPRPAALRRGRARGGDRAARRRGGHGQRPRHLAAALGVPTFGWFGPTHPDTWNPPGERHGFWWTDLPCRGCDRTSCPHWTCLPSLEPARAAALVLEHLERHGR